MVEDSEGEEEDKEEESGLEYETDTPSKDSYTTPPSTGGCSELLWLLVILLLQRTPIPSLTWSFILRNWRHVLRHSWKRWRMIWR